MEVQIPAREAAILRVKRGPPRPHAAMALVLFRIIFITVVGAARVEVEVKRKKEAEEIKSKVKPRTIWDKPDIIDVTTKSLTLRWKPSSVPQYAVEVSRDVVLANC